jgi:predicted nuclease with TOPRIM domain
MKGRPGIVGRWLLRWADADTRGRLEEARNEIKRLEAEVQILNDQIRRLMDWQQRETQRLERETAIFTAEKIMAIERGARPVFEEHGE